MSIEIIEHQGVRYAEIIWAGVTVHKSTFFSPEDASFQFGLLAHEAGFQEVPHYHCEASRQINDMQQMLVVQRGKLAVQFFDKAGKMFSEVTLGVGDSINLVHGSHAIRVIEDMQCVSVKQGPFLGVEMDKVEIKVSK